MSLPLQDTRSTPSATTEMTCDVLVIGGGPAGCWAALEAVGAEARVVLVDKGYCGSSGATASAGTQIWYVPPDEAARDAAMASREAMGGSATCPAEFLHTVRSSRHRSLHRVPK